MLLFDILWWGADLGMILVSSILNFSHTHMSHYTRHYSWHLEFEVWKLKFPQAWWLDLNSCQQRGNCTVTIELDLSTLLSHQPSYILKNPQLYSYYSIVNLILNFLMTYHHDRNIRTNPYINRRPKQLYLLSQPYHKTLHHTHQIPTSHLNTT